MLFRSIHVLIPAGKPTKGNVVVRYPGRLGAAGGKPILLLAHLDVVAARREEWPRDPFTMVEQDGFFLGRGTADDKAMAAIFVANLIRLKKENYVPDRDIIVALTADEEGGTANGVDWLLKNHKPLVDAGLVFNEGGGGTTRDGKPLFNAVQATEKVFANVTIRTTNKGGH